MAKCVLGVVGVNERGGDSTKETGTHKDEQSSLDCLL